MFLLYSIARSTVHHIPGPTGFRDLHCSDIDRGFPRAEEAFLKYIGTSQWLENRTDPQAAESLKGAPLPELPPTNSQKKVLDHRHDYEIIVGKNVTCRKSDFKLRSVESHCNSTCFRPCKYHTLLYLSSIANTTRSVAEDEFVSLFHFLSGSDLQWQCGCSYDWRHGPHSVPRNFCRRDHSRIQLGIT